MIYPIATVQTAYQQYVERMFMNRTRTFSYKKIARVEPYHGQTESNSLDKDNKKNHLSSMKNGKTNGIDQKGMHIDFYA